MARLPLLFSASILASAACSDTSGPNPAEQIYTAALAQWNESGPASYDMVLKRQCICQVSEIDVTIQVRNRVVVSRTFTASGDPVGSGQVSLYPDVPGLFALVRAAMDDDPVFLSATYDQTYGHPIEIQLDLDGSRSDDNVVYTTLQLTPVT